MHKLYNCVQIYTTTIIINAKNKTKKSIKASTATSFAESLHNKERYKESCATSLYLPLISDSKYFLSITVS